MTELSDPAWLTETLRGTAFGDVSLEEAQVWWSQYVDVEPDSETVKAKVGQYSAQCDFMDGILSLHVQPGRTDWFIRAKRPDEMEELGFLNFGEITAPLERFSTIFKSWVSEREGLSRIAFGTVLFLPTDDRLAGYKSVQALLPAVQIDVENSSDFFYQINRPYSSMTGIDGLALNRLSKWSVLRLFGGQFRVDSDKGIVSTLSQEQFAVRLELDISTPAEFGNNLPVDRQADIFDELIALGMEISRQGDQP